MKENEISIAIVRNSENLFLISLRDKKAHQGGKWEFPGGKVEKDEQPEQAMCRELSEEVGLNVLNYQLIESKFFDYGDTALHLHFYLVTQFSGDAHGREGQPIKWISKAELALYEFPEANRTVLERL
ncbi:MAG: 8-oxo-dGTP diphosphatase MutT [Psychromonas sp.]|nr:8-oxo-dGTP diphosphatase MutT [Psychromonas sp.]